MKIESKELKKKIKNSILSVSEVTTYAKELKKTLNEASKIVLKIIIKIKKKEEQKLKKKNKKIQKQEPKVWKATKPTIK
jgi:ElaB/YqjD/DUF883 family membrane-anchored ribosome-binding protein